MPTAPGNRAHGYGRHDLPFVPQRWLKPLPMPNHCTYSLHESWPGSVGLSGLHTAIVEPTEVVTMII